MSQTSPHNNPSTPPDDAPAPGDLVKAVIVNDMKEVKRLLAQGVDIDETFGADGKTALIQAVWSGSLEVVTLLVERGAAIDKTDVYNDTALMWAALKGREDVVRFLLDPDARLDLRDDDSDNAHSMALIGGHSGIADMLRMEPVVRQRRAEEKRKAEEEARVAAALALEEKRIHDAALAQQLLLRTARVKIKLRQGPRP